MRWLRELAGAQETGVECGREGRLFVKQSLLWVGVGVGEASWDLVLSGSEFR